MKLTKKGKGTEQCFLLSCSTLQSESSRGPNFAREVNERQAFCYRRAIQNLSINHGHTAQMQTMNKMKEIGEKTRITCQSKRESV
jgi:hypothetical protein